MIFTTNHALKSPSRRAGDQSNEENVIVRGALQGGGGAIWFKKNHPLAQR
jgi:hypothetical protein